MNHFSINLLPFTEHAFFCSRQAALREQQSYAARQTQAEKRLSVKAALHTTNYIYMMCALRHKSQPCLPENSCS